MLDLKISQRVMVCTHLYDYIENHPPALREGDDLHKILIYSCLLWGRACKKYPCWIHGVNGSSDGIGFCCQ